MARPSPSSDIWSLGVTLLEFLTFKDAWEQVLEGQDGDTELKKLVAALKASLLPASLFMSLSAYHRANIKMCLSYKKELCPTAVTLLDCKW